MTAMKKGFIALGLAVSLGASQGAMAFPGAGPCADLLPKGQWGGYAFAKILDLSPSQIKEIKSIRLEYRADANPVNHIAEHVQQWVLLDPNSVTYQQDVADFADQQAIKTAKRIRKRGEMQEEINAVLTPEQREKMAVLKEDMGDHAKQCIKRVKMRQARAM